MPTYDYECQDCGYKFEYFQKMTDSPLKVCPRCKGNLRKIIGQGCGIIFKGQGFYVTDYKNQSGKIVDSDKGGKVKTPDPKNPSSKNNSNSLKK